ncbi:hypothetical protein SAMN04488057_102251 [Cyclobacterium lianum]|uniref:Uncharacterized protein n=1 Tax=Cyclobacterium lianum TaxID=388280 RepID=A0A1M7K1P7_9BACT|nr:hypothetical protein [Cyclobacterium lianum]SHM59101.1 hypothetical protein SAMN04488057_102251 [Cyclobacterium lianum]
MAAFGAVAVMLVACWQFGVSGTEAPFSENEVALENAIAGSGYGGLCCDWYTGVCGHPIGDTFKKSLWYGGYSDCF